MKRLLLLLPLIVLGGCTRQVPPASVGIKFDAGSGISEQLLKPQVVWVMPRQRLIVYPTSIRNATYVRAAGEGERAGDDSIPASTIEGSLLPVDVTVSYHVDPGNVTKAFTNFGTSDLASIQSGYLRWATIYATNVVSGSRSIFDLTSRDRAAFGGQIKKVLAPIAEEWGLTVDDVFVGEVYPNDSVRQKVESRLQTQNGLELAKVGLEKARIDARTTLTNARKDARLAALLAEQGEKALELRRLELRRMAIDKWDGRPPIIGGSEIPFAGVDPR